MTLDDWKEYTAEELLEKVENKEIRYSTGLKKLMEQQD